MQQFEQQNPHIPVIRLDGDQLDFVENEADMSYVLQEIEKVVQKGVRQ